MKFVDYLENAASVTFLVFTITIAILTAAETNAQSFDDIFNISHNIFSEVDNDLTNSNIKSNKMSLTKIYLAGPPIELGKFRVLVNHLDALSGVLTMRIVIKGIRADKQGNPTNIVDRIIEAIETNGSVAVEESNEVSIKTNSDNIVVI